MEAGGAWGDDDTTPASRVLAAALSAFAAQGYHGTSIRDLAAGAGLSVPGVYHHYPSKQAILRVLMVETMATLTTHLRAALAAAPDEPGARFDALVAALVGFHLRHGAESFVASSELRSLTPEHRAEVVGQRDEVQRMIDAAVAGGVAAGLFATPAPAEAARAISVLAIGVATWYRPDGPAPADVVVAQQCALARALVLDRR